MRDLVGAAETGSGKTLAFGLPILHRLIEDLESEAAAAAAAASAETAAAAEEGEEGDGEEGEGVPTAQRGPGGSGLVGGSLFALIMTPTRELAMQVTSHLQAAASQCALLPKGAPCRCVYVCV